MYDFFFVHSSQTRGSILLGYLIKFLKLICMSQYFFRRNGIDVPVQNQVSSVSKFLGSIKFLRMSDVLRKQSNSFTKSSSFTKEQIFLAIEILM